jgi:N-acetylglutamate synthase-like GNAT family acetyltransferase
MSSMKFQARRATVDDLPTLKSLWTSMNYSVLELEKHLTEFQVVTDETGQIVGAVGFQMIAKHARLHSETYGDFSLADYARPVLWQRIHTLATNHGLARLWTQEQSPFWSRNGFIAAKENDFDNMPSAWDRFDSGWLTLKLKDEEAVTSLDKEFALFVESEKRSREDMLAKTRVLKTVFLIFVTLVVIAILGATVWLFIKQRGSGALTTP